MKSCSECSHFDENHIERDFATGRPLRTLKVCEKMFEGATFVRIIKEEDVKDFTTSVPNWCPLEAVR